MAEAFLELLKLINSSKKEHRDGQSYFKLLFLICPCKTFCSDSCCKMGCTRSVSVECNEECWLLLILTRFVFNRYIFFFCIPCSFGNRYLSLKNRFVLSSLNNIVTLGRRSWKFCHSISYGVCCLQYAWICVTFVPMTLWRTGGVGPDLSALIQGALVTSLIHVLYKSQPFLTLLTSKQWSSGAFPVELMLRIMQVFQSTGSFFPEENNRWNQNNVKSAVSLLWHYDTSKVLS